MPDDPPELWYTDELESDPVAEELLALVREGLETAVDQIWEARVSAFNKRFQAELHKALTDYAESAIHWLSVDEDGSLKIVFGYIDMADGIPRNERPLKEVLEEFVSDWSDDAPEVQRAKRLLEAWDA